MSQITKTAKIEVNTKQMAWAVFLNVLAAMFGFISARASVQAAFSPFGIAMVAAAPKTFTPATVLGAAAGYFIPVNGFGGFKYIAALAAVASIKYMLCSVRNLAQNKIISALSCFLSLGATSVMVSSFDAYSVLIAIAEGVLAAAACYFFNEAFLFFKSESSSPDSLKLCSIIISVNILLLGLFSIEFFDVSLGRLLSSVFLLAAARYGKAPTAAVCGVSVALSVTLNNLAFSGSALIFCVAGLITGIFSASGKIACSVSYVLTFVLSSILFGGGELNLVLAVEAVFATAVFLVLPRSFSKKLASVLSPLTVKTSEPGKCNALTMRLGFAAEALSDVSATVDTVAKELSKINCPDFDSIVDSLHCEVCKGCNLNERCWSQGNEQTRGFIAKMAGNIHSDPDNISPDEFKALCIRRDEFEQTFKDKYTHFLTCLDNEDRLAQVRSVVADQFDSVSNMLRELSNEFTNDEHYDTLLADKIACSLREIGVIVHDCGCRVDKYKRMTVEIRVHDKNETIFNRMQILRRIENICERDFENPCILKAKSDVLITLSEKACYTVDTAVKQINSGDNSVCGDAYSCFYDGRGRYIMLLSDGMGSGGRAAVDGAMTTNILTRLIKAGFGWDCSLKILNSSMLFKSTDESLATVDAVCIDLFTGKTELFKAGAAPTIVLRSGRSGIAKSTSLPAGILQGIGFDKATITLRHKDITLMLSDGAISDGTDWICAVLESFEGTANELCNKIASDALRRRCSGKNDDITVIATVLNKVI